MGAYGRLIVLERLPMNGGRRCVRCRCDCGREVVVNESNVKRGLTRSCGCLRRELAGSQSITHGGSRATNRHPLYGVWKGMRKRCFYRGDKRWQHYGGRGITICDRWLGRDGFANFLADMGPRPDGHVLDRCDNDGNYEPANCRWATLSESNRNRRPFKRGGQ